MQLLQGIPASPGIAIGHAVILDRGRLSFEKHHISTEQISSEQDRLRQAFQTSIEELRTLQNKFAREGAEHGFILEAQVLMLQDPLLVQGAIDRIAEERVNAEWALRLTSLHIREFFERIEEAYFRERTTDVESITDRVMTNLLHCRTDDNANIVQPQEGVPILISSALSPSETVQWLSAGIIGIAVEGGSPTSHTTIVARSLEVPAVMGIKNLTKVIGNGDRIIIDGDTGGIIVRPSHTQCLAYAQRRDADKAFHYELRQNRSEPACSEDGEEVALLANIELPEELPAIAECGGNGIGLLRTEFLFLRNTGIPSEDEQTRYYRTMIENSPESLVTIRTLDIGGDKIAEENSTPRALRPFFGLRAIRYCLQEQSIFRTQLRAIMRAAAQGEVRVLIPFISSVGEIEDVRRIMRETSAQLAADKVPHRADLPLGVMIELPAAAITAQTLAEHVDFFSVGTNDLIQYTLAADREEEEANIYYQPLHPAVMALLNNVALAGQAANIPVGICGEMAGVPLYTELLFGLGYRELSMASRNIPVVKRIIQNLNQAEAQELSRSILLCKREEEARKLLATRMHHRFPDLFPSPY